MGKSTGVDVVHVSAGLAPTVGVFNNGLKDLPAEAVLESFRRYLLSERALAPLTVEAYALRARRFLAGLAGCEELAGLTTRAVTDAVLKESVSFAPASTQFYVVALRSFLRFCFLEGLTPFDVSAAALGLRGHRHRSPLPLGISRSDVDALLKSCDLRRSMGRRDRAILLLLLRLGLRAGEVSVLTLEDIDWRAGQIVVHGKGGRVDSLPLPTEVGAAIAGYLRWGRPKSERREVFLGSLAPLEPLGRSAVSRVVRRACQHAGLDPIGSHRLRHTVACDMIAAGASLPEISQLLRQRDISTTATYARVDLDALRRLAQPWPGGVK